MSTARNSVMTSIRQALRRGELDFNAKRALDEQLSQPRPNVLPQVDGDLVERFVARARALSVTIAQVATFEEAPGAVAAYVAECKLPTQVVVAAALGELAWPEPLNVRTGAAAKADLVSVTPCFAAVAETGSLVMLSSSLTPTTLNFVPDHHVVIVRRNQIVRHVEEVWVEVRKLGDMLPRSINVISGPSRTADVEQTVQLGAHGPRSVHIVLVET